MSVFHEIWTISDGSGGESNTVGHAESESEVEIVGIHWFVLEIRNFETQWKLSVQFVVYVFLVYRGPTKV